jgi:hypothetical protein
MTIDATGRIVWEPKSDQIGDEWVGIRSTDGFLCAVQYFKIHSIKSNKSFSISIIKPTKFDTIKEGKIIVIGKIQTTNSEEMGVIVNNIPAMIHGDTFIACNVPVVIGKNKIISTATTISGNQTADSVEIMVDSIKPTFLHIDTYPNSALGIAPFTINFRAIVGIDSVTMYKWDLNGDGTVDTSGPLLDSVTETYNQSGIFIAKCFIYNNDRIIDSCNQSVVAMTINEITSVIK